MRSPSPGEGFRLPDLDSGAMNLSRRQISQAVSDGTGLSSEEVGLLVAVALGVAGVVLALRAVDFVSRHLPRS